MKVKEFIEKLQALEDQDMEVVAIDHEYGAYLIDEPEIREEYSRGYDTVKVVVLDDTVSRFLWDIDPKYITKGEPPKRTGPNLVSDSILRNVFMSQFVPPNQVFLTTKDNLPPDATHIEFKIHDDRKDQNEGS